MRCRRRHYLMCVYNKRSTHGTRVYDCVLREVPPSPGHRRWWHCSCSSSHQSRSIIKSPHRSPPFYPPPQASAKNYPSCWSFLGSDSSSSSSSNNSCSSSIHDHHESLPPLLLTIYGNLFGVGRFDRARATPLPRHRVY
uniref:Uncharacterized protein n=1 Tax=Sipha flava TaxID=143950 RepID=A0A2S2QGT5_9HEMI